MDRRKKIRVADEMEIFGWARLEGRSATLKITDVVCTDLIYLIWGGLFKNVMICECVANQPVIKHLSWLIHVEAFLGQTLVRKRPRNHW